MPACARRSDTIDMVTGDLNTDPLGPNLRTSAVSVLSDAAEIVPRIVASTTVCTEMGPARIYAMAGIVTPCFLPFFRIDTCCVTVGSIVTLLLKMPVATAEIGVVDGLAIDVTTKVCAFGVGVVLDDVEDRCVVSGLLAALPALVLLAGGSNGTVE